MFIIISYRRSEVVCKEYLEEGSCEVVNSTVARWGYHPYSRRCVPFYYSGCGGNENNFVSQAECEEVCPTIFSPVISLPDGEELLVRRGEQELQLAVAIRANPAPSVVWRHQGRQISSYDNQYSVLDDFSLLITNIGDHNGGVYSVEASNGVGEGSMVDITVIIYPILPSIKLVVDKTVYKPGSDISIECNIQGKYLQELHTDNEDPGFFTFNIGLKCLNVLNVLRNSTLSGCPND